MDIIIILIVLFVIFGNVKNKKKQQEAQEARRRAAQAQQGGQPQRFDMPYTPLAPTMEGKDADPRFPEYAPEKKEDPRFPDYTPPVQQAAPRSVQQQPAMQPATQQQMRQRQAPPPQQRHVPPPQARTQSQTYEEGTGPEIQHASISVRSSESTLQATQGRRHTLEASSITGHAHTEAGMSGVQEACPPAQRVTVSRKTSSKAGIAALMTDKDTLRQAVLYSEILGKPKALRR
jgi:hypothetical protein